MVNICVCGCGRNLSVEICGTLEYVSQTCEMRGCTEVPGLGETICNSCWDKHDSYNTPGFPEGFDDISEEHQAWLDREENAYADRAAGDQEPVDRRDENENEFVVEESLPCVAPKDSIFIFCSDCGDEGSAPCSCHLCDYCRVQTSNRRKNGVGENGELLCDKCHEEKYHAGIQYPECTRCEHLTDNKFEYGERLCDKCYEEHYHAGYQYPDSEECRRAFMSEVPCDKDGKFCEDCCKTHWLELEAIKATIRERSYNERKDAWSVD